MKEIDLVQNDQVDLLFRVACEIPACDIEDGVCYSWM
jgi:hypothetical protein